MKIALFHNLPPGGAKRVVYEITKRLSTNNNQIDLYIYDTKAEDFLNLSEYVNNVFLLSHGNTDNISGISRIISLFKVKNASKKIAKKINEGNYDISIIMQCKVSNSPFLLKYLKTPSLYFCHEPLAKIKEPHYRLRKHDGLLSFFKNLLINYFIFIDKSNAIYATHICTSSYYSIENIYRNYGIYPSLNYLGVDTNKFKDLKLKRNNTILFVGSLNIAKGQDFVLESIGKMVIKPEIKFIYNFSYGNKHFINHLKKRANELNIRVTFQKMASDNDLVVSYNEAMITVFPSRLEPLGLVPLESMSCGTPVIGISEAGIRETIVNGVNGILTERDVNEFANAINSLMSDKFLWDSYSLNGIDNIYKKWTWDKALDVFEINLQKTLLKFHNTI